MCACSAHYISEDNPRSDHGRIMVGLSSNRLYPLIGRSLVSEKESGSCYSDDRVQKHGKQEFEEI